MSINTLPYNSTIVDELALVLNKTNLVSNLKLLSVTSGNSPTTLLSRNITIQKPGDQIIALFACTFSAPTTSNVLNVIASMGLSVTPVSLTKTISPNIIDNFIGVFNLTSSSSQPSSQTLQFSASALNAGSNLATSTSSSYCYSLLIFEVLS